MGYANEFSILTVERQVGCNCHMISDLSREYIANEYERDESGDTSWCNIFFSESLTQTNNSAQK